MDELQVYFCDLCTTSVPEQDLDTGDAIRLHDKVIGSCCLKELRGGATTEAKAGGARSGSAAGWFATAFVMLVAVAGATVFLEWRVAEEAKNLGSSMSSSRDAVTRLDERLVSVERRLGATLSDGALNPIETKIASIQAELGGVEERVIGSVRGNATRLRDLGTHMHSLDSGQREQIARTAEFKTEVQSELRRLGDRVDEIAAAPRMPTTPVVDAGATNDEGDGAPAMPEPDALPEPLSGFVAQLTDRDDGARFEAVDELLQSGDPRVFPHILPLASDADPFVRRLVFEGLKDFRDATAVDALIQALGDAESLVRYTAYASLKALTSHDITFDPDAAAGKRASMQRRWQEWWDKNRGDLF